MLIFCLLSLSVSLQAQYILISKSSLHDGPHLRNAVKKIAQQVLEDFEVRDSAADLDNLFRLQLCAGLYDESVRTLKLFRSVQPDQQWGGLPALGIQFEVTAVSFSALQQKETDSASVIYRSAQQLYDRMPEPSKPYVQQFFQPDVDGLKQRFEKSRELLGMSSKGRAAREEAIRFCRLHLSLEIARLINRDALRFLTDEDNKHYVIDDSLLIPGADSSLLTAVVVRKHDVTEPQPVILVYSIYAGPKDLAIAKRAADHGYVGVVVNTRGKFLSSAPLVPFEHDAEDSWPVLDYLSKQEYCDGSIGMYGGSYLGFSQWSALKSPHPALKTIVPQVAVAPGIDFPSTGGVNGTYGYQWLRYVSNNPFTDYLTFNNSSYWDSLNQAWFISGLPLDRYDSLAGREDKTFRKWLEHPVMDEYWKSLIPADSDFAAIDIPVLTITGYFDDDQAGALHYYNQHLKYSTNPRHYLLIGPWDHFGAQSSPDPVLRGYQTDSCAVINIDQLVFEWMDYVFRAKPLPALIKDQVNLQVMGANTWWHGKQLSEQNGEVLGFHLLQDQNNHYLLSATAPVVTRRMQLTRNDLALPGKEYGYDAPVPLKDSILPSKSGIYFRSDVLKDTSYLHGRYTLDLKLIPDCYDADLITRLYEETADGEFLLLGTGLNRISNREISTQPVYMRPGELNEVQLESLYFTERMLRPGSRILLWLDIHASTSYEFNNGEKGKVSAQDRRDFKGIRLNILSDSKLMLPVRKE